MDGLLSAWRNWRQRSEILRDVKRRAAAQKEFDRYTVRDRLVEALAALTLNDTKKAAAIWDEALAMDADAAVASPHAIKLLTSLKRFDEAEALMTEGQRRHPADPHYPAVLAQLSELQGDLEASVARYAAMRKRFPAEGGGYAGGSDVLMRLGRLEEAEALSRDMMQRFPEDIRGFLGCARVLMERQDWDAALAQWRLMAERFPDRDFGVLGIARVYTNQGRFDEADAVLEEGRSRYSANSGLFIESARIAQARGDIPEAIRRWKRRVEKFPMEWFCYHQAAEALEELQAFDEAEAVLRAGVDRFDDNSLQLTNLAKFYQRRSNAAAEAEIWATFRERFPSLEVGYTSGAVALQRLGDTAGAEAVRAAFQQRLAAQSTQASG